MSGVRRYTEAFRIFRLANFCKQVVNNLEADDWRTFQECQNRPFKAAQTIDIVQVIATIHRPNTKIR